MEAVLVRGAAQALFQAAVCDVKCGVLVGRSSLSADDRAVRARGQLHLERAIGQPGIGLFGDLDVDSAQGDPELVDAVQLVVDVLPEALGHLNVSAVHHDLSDVAHEALLLVDNPPIQHASR